LSSPQVEPAVAPPPGNPRFPLVDGVRAVAVAGVVITHVLFKQLGGVTAQLGVGVDIFFLVSGFLLYRPFFAAQLEGGRGPRLRDYARRRLLRILPAYWAALLLLSVYPGLKASPLSADGLVQFAFLQNLSSDTAFDGIVVSWSLCVEMAFYLALPLYALAMHRLGARRSARSRIRLEYGVLLAIGAFGLAWQLVIYTHWGFVLAAWSVLPASLMYFAAGMALAVASASRTDPREPPALLRPLARRPGLAWLGALALLAWLSLPLDPGGRRSFDPSRHPILPAEHVLKEVLLRLAIAALILVPAIFGLERAGAPRRFLSAPAVAWIGLISYGIYLYHLPVDQVTHGSHLGIGPPPEGVADVLTPLVTIAVAAASYYVIERPFLRWKPGLRRSRGEAVGQPAAARQV
jgi:peptidoglycan/LPS O-acetylase OafA/YrhL